MQTEAGYGGRKVFAWLTPLFSLLAVFGLHSASWAMCSTPPSGCASIEAKVRAALPRRATRKCILLTKGALLNDRPRNLFFLVNVDRSRRTPSIVQHYVNDHSVEQDRLELSCATMSCINRTFDRFWRKYGRNDRCRTQGGSSLDSMNPLQSIEIVMQLSPSPSTSGHDQGAK